MKPYSIDIIRNIDPPKNFSGLWAETGITYGSSITGLIMKLDAGNPESYPKAGIEWYDISGRNNNAYINSELYYQELGGGSIYFDGGVIVGTNLSPDFSYLNNNITIDSVIYCDDLSTHRQICSKGFGYQYRFRIQIDGSLWVYSINNGPLSGGYIELNTWTYVATVLSDTGIRIYINGELVNSSSVPYSPDSNFSDTSGLYIGAYNSTMEFFSGNIATLRIYNMALTDDDIMQNFNLIKTIFDIQ